MIILFFQCHICNLILLFSSQSLQHDTLVFSKAFKDMMAFFLLDKNEKILLSYEKMKEE